MAKLAQLTIDTIAQMVRETGHVVGMADIAEIVQMERLAQKIANPHDPAEIKYIDSPIREYGHEFWPPSIGVSIWAIEAYEWFRNDPYYQMLVTAFACCHAHEPELTDRMTDKESAKAALRKFARGLRLTVRQLANVFMRMLPEPGSETARQSEAADNYGPIFSVLWHEYGMRIEDARKASSQLVRALLADHDRRVEEQAAEIAAVGGGKRSGPTKLPNTARLAAHRALVKVKARMLKRWRQECLPDVKQEQAA